VLINDVAAVFGRCRLCVELVAWYSGRTLVFDRRAFAVLRSTYS